MSKPIYRVCFLILMILVIASIWAGVFAARGYLEWSRMSRRTAHVSKKIKLVEIEIHALESKIKAIESDQGAQERLVRSQLGYIKEGESVIELD